MASVSELSAPYGNFMLGPKPGPGVCEICFDLTGGPRRCRHCAQDTELIDAVAPIAYSIDGEQLHHALAGYKRPPQDVAARFQVELAAVLWRFLATHEPCLAAAAGLESEGFDLVTTVPSSTPERDQTHPLNRLVAELVSPTRSRFRRLLRRTDSPVEPRTVSAEKFTASTRLGGRTVLLVDDTWTTGANARSAATALRAAGAARIGVVVIGRHLHREWRGNDGELRALPVPFDWSDCALHSQRLSDLRVAPY